MHWAAILCTLAGIALASCGGGNDSGSESSAGGSGQGGAASSSNGAVTGSTASSSGAGGATSAGSGSSSGTGGGQSGPELLYDGPVGGTLAGWNATDPRPLVALGQTTPDHWTMTLLSVQPDGTLGDNAASRVLVWSWAAGATGAPAKLYDGPVGGMLAGFNANAPWPLVALGGTNAPAAWTMTLLQVETDGTLSMNAAERIIVWGWQNAGPSQYEGPVGGKLSGWNAAAPDPLVGFAQFTMPTMSWMTLVSIAPDGTLSNNVADKVYLWRF